MVRIFSPSDPFCAKSINDVIMAVPQRGCAAAGDDPHRRWLPVAITLAVVDQGGHKLVFCWPPHPTRGLRPALLAATVRQAAAANNPPLSAPPLAHHPHGLHGGVAPSASSGALTRAISSAGVGPISSRAGNPDGSTGGSSGPGSGGDRSGGPSRGASSGADAVQQNLGIGTHGAIPSPLLTKFPCTRADPRPVSGAVAPAVGAAPARV